MHCQSGGQDRCVSCRACLRLCLQSALFVIAHVEIKTLCRPAGLWATCFQKDSAYGLTLVWSFVAVYGKPHSKTVHAAALGATVAMCIASILSVLRRRGQPSSDVVNVADMRQPLKSCPRAQTIPS